MSNITSSAMTRSRHYRTARAYSRTRTAWTRRCYHTSTTEGSRATRGRPCTPWAPYFRCTGPRLLWQTRAVISTLAGADSRLRPSTGRVGALWPRTPSTPLQPRLARPTNLDCTPHFTWIPFRYVGTRRAGFRAHIIAYSTWRAARPGCVGKGAIGMQATCEHAAVTRLILARRRIIAACRSIIRKHASSIATTTFTTEIICACIWCTIHWLTSILGILRRDWLRKKAWDR